MRESISYSPWRRMAIPIATGNRRNDWVDTICSALTHTGALSVSVRVSREEAMVSRYKTATTAAGREPLQLQAFDAVRAPEAPDETDSARDDAKGQQRQEDRDQDAEDRPSRLQAEGIRQRRYSAFLEPTGGQVDDYE